MRLLFIRKIVDAGQSETQLPNGLLLLNGQPLMLDGFYLVWVPA